MLGTLVATILQKCLERGWTQNGPSEARAPSRPAASLVASGFRWRKLALLTGLCLGSACACSESADEQSSGPGGVAGASNDELEVAIEFANSATLTLAPTEVATLSLRLSPARRQTVIFEILSDDPLFDGFLSNNAVRTRSDGSASVSLQAPSTPSTFVVRASVGSVAEARLAVSVSSRGYGTLLVEPNYSGERTILEWSASARAGAACEDLETLLTDGPLVGRDATTPRIESVPAGPRLAVSLRGNGLVTGCLNVAQISPEEELVLSIPVTDVPLNLGEGKLLARFGIQSTTSEWANQVERSLNEARTLLTAETGEGENALITWMSGTLDGSDSASFAANRSAFDFDSIASSVSSNSLFTSEVDALLVAGATQFTSDDAFVGIFSLTETEATLRLEGVAGSAPDEAGFAVESNWELAVESGDMLSLGGRLDYRPLLLLRAAAAARAESSDEIAPVSRLTGELDCGRLALELTAASAGSVYDGCTAACAAALCETGVQAAWDALTTSNTEAKLQVGVSAHVLVSDEPVISALEGSWLGRLTDEVVTTGSTSLQGQVVAERN